MALADACAAELCAGCGFHWLLIDGEHAPNDLRGYKSPIELRLMQAVKAALDPEGLMNPGKLLAATPAQATALNRSPSIGVAPQP